MRRSTPAVRRVRAAAVLPEATFPARWMRRPMVWYRSTLRIRREVKAGPGRSIPACWITVLAAMGPSGQQFVVIGVGNKGREAQKDAGALLTSWFDRVRGIKRRTLISKRSFEAAVTGHRPGRRP
jgi:hypothetical protein